MTNMISPLLLLSSDKETQQLQLSTTGEKRAFDGIKAYYKRLGVPMYNVLKIFVAL